MNKLLGKVKQKFSGYLIYIIIIFVLLLKSLYFMVSSKLYLQPVFSISNLLMIIMSILTCILIVSLVLFFKRKKLVFTIINLAISILLIADLDVMKYYYTPVSLNMIASVDLRMLGGVGDSVSNVMSIWDFLLIIDIPICIWLVVKDFFYKRVSNRKIKCGAIVIAVSLIAILLTTIPIRACLDGTENKIIASTGPYYFHLKNTFDFLANKISNKSLSEKDKDVINKYFTEKNSNTKSDYKGILKGRNVIVLQLEALQQFYIGAKVNGEEITPNLNKLIGESLYFNNIYYQVAGGNTSDAEFDTNTSMYPAKEGSAYALYQNNYFHSMPALLKEQGYKAYSFHAYKNFFWNRDVMHYKLGFDRFYSEKDFKLDDMYGFSEGKGLSDISFYRQVREIQDKSQPYYSFMISLSSHHPFYAFDKDTGMDVGKYKNTFLGNSIKAQHYSDKAIGTLMQKLKDEGVYDSTVFVLYGDHSAIPKSEFPALAEFLGLPQNDFTWVSLQKIPLIIHCEGLDAGKIIDITGGQVDILPTLANLLGLDAPYAMGTDLLNASSNSAIFRNGSFVNGDVYYDNWKDTFYQLSKDTVLDNDADKVNMKDQAAKELRINDLIQNKDAFRSMLR